jgi:hypothetical protein
MPELKVGETITTTSATLEVVQSTLNPLSVGPHVFHLVVVDDAQNVSEAAKVEVTVLDNKAPTAILHAPASVPYGSPITLDGRDSTDLLGRIVEYRWTRMS